MVAIPATVTNQQLQIRKFTRTFVHGRDPEDEAVSDREEERTERRERWRERERWSVVVKSQGATTTARVSTEDSEDWGHLRTRSF